MENTEKIGIVAKIKVIIALFVILFTVYTLFNTIIPKTYSGTDLSVWVSAGTIAFSNETSADVTLTALSRSAFQFDIGDGTTLASTREGTGRASEQTATSQFAPGIHELSVRRGSDITVNLVASESLTVNVNERSANETSVMVFIALAIILGALFYASSATHHTLIRNLRNKQTAVPSHATA